MSDLFSNQRFPRKNPPALLESREGESKPTDESEEGDWNGLKNGFRALISCADSGDGQVEECVDVEEVEGDEHGGLVLDPSNIVIEEVAQSLAAVTALIPREAPTRNLSDAFELLVVNGRRKSA